MPSKKKTAATKRAVKAGQQRSTSTRAKSAAAPNTRSVVVTVGDAHLPDIDAVADSLRSRGMQVDAVLKGAGLITGAYSKATASLQRVKGVSSVEEQPQVQLPPPDAEVQ